MKAAAIIGLLGCGAVTAAPEAAYPAWKWEQAVEVPAAGVVRLDLPPATLDGAQPALADLRLLSPDGVETPGLLANPAPGTPAEREAEAPIIRLLEAAPNIEAATQLEFATGTELAIEAVTLRTPAREFLKSVTVEGTADGENWQVITTGEVIFRQSNGPERLRVALPPKAWRKLRVSVSDARSRPVPITSASVSLAVPDRQETIPLEAVVRETTQTATATQVAVDLGFANLHLESLQLDIADPVFSRRYRLSVDAAGQSGSVALASGMLYRVVGENGAATEQLSIPVNRRIPVARLTLTLENGDSPPLTIKGAGAARFASTLEFHAAKAGAWSLLSGNPKAAAPSYDLTPLRATLAKAPGQRLSPGALRPKADYQAAPALPGVDPAGVPIDLTHWTRRCAVSFPGTGVNPNQLKPLQLANSRDDLADLRLVQNGRQLPYLIESRNTVRSLPCELSNLGSDPERPTVSRWSLRPPVPNLRASELILSSPTPVFTRTMVAGFSRPDQGYPSPAGYTVRDTWTRTTASGSDEFRLQVGGIPLPESFKLETDNGDNPPIELAKARLTYLAPVLAAKLVSSEPVFLYYGNSRAAAPSYDLGLMRADLLAADKHAATWLDEEIRRPGDGRP